MAGPWAVGGEAAYYTPPLEELECENCLEHGTSVCGFCDPHYDPRERDYDVERELALEWED